MPRRLERADTLILLEADRFTCLIRYLKRCRRAGDRPGKPDGTQKEFSLKMLRYILFRQPKRWKEQMEIIARYPHLETLVLRSFEEIDAFTDSLVRKGN